MDVTKDFFNYKRRKTTEVLVGTTPLGGENPIRIQSMTNTSTMDTAGSIEQSIAIIKSGGEYVRLTAQGVREAKNLKAIKKGLRERGYTTPLVADIHFNPKAAEVAAGIVEKVRINPGNFVDPARTFKKLSYTKEEYQEELERLRERLLPLLAICKKQHTAIRLGVNHGSLSDRIMSYYGDTPEGMVESCMEFLRICKEEAFHAVVISVKSSNTVVMVRTVRQMVLAMEKEEMSYPLHLGVTEAGEGEDGRIKSAVGIGALLQDGLGDTIRVSLTEPPEAEIPVAQKLVDYCTRGEGLTTKIKGEIAEAALPLTKGLPFVRSIRQYNLPFPLVLGVDLPEVILPKSFKDFQRIKGYNLYTTPCSSLTTEQIEQLQSDSRAILILTAQSKNKIGAFRLAFHQLMKANCDVPVILHAAYKEDCLEDLQLKAAADLGLFFIDGLANGLVIENEGSVDATEITHLSLGILQAARARFSKTEYIACPGCGRTLFDLQKTLARVKAATAHLKGLKIGVMGCIVNGPGEMADADYGYIGAARGKISLFKQKECVEKNIDEAQAVEKLIDLIKANGDWVEVEEKN